MKTNLLLLFLWLCWLGISAPVRAGTVDYNLVLAKTAGPDQGGPQAMTINGSLPGPTLRFTEGDDAVLRVRNDLTEDTSIHWHGLLVPNDQDGVPHVTMSPIQPGETRVYRFPLRQSGTFWYHSHSGLQEQLGIYGSIVITPKDGERIKTDHDVVAVLSDWTDEKPLDVLTQLRAGREWQGIKKGTAQSWLGAAQHGALKGFLNRSLKRMPPMDLSDVAYRHFLVNGKSEAALAAAPGETVRLRLVNASTATYYFIEFAGGAAKIISADGGDVEPVAAGRFLMATAETYDLLITVPAEGAYELRATAQDGSGKSSFFVGRGERHLAPDVPRANLYAAHSMPGMAGGAMKMNGGDAAVKTNAMSHAGMKHGAMEPPMKEMNHAAMGHGGSDVERPGTPYEKLRAFGSTVLSAGRPLREYTFHLQGDMIRYVWTLDGKTMTEADPVNVRRGERVRFTFTNETMMHHPMHLHGHFFRVLTGAGDFSPLKHTVDVPPGETRVIEFAADEPGDWMMHCHVLYHLAVGMARVVHYEDAPPNPHLHGRGRVAKMAHDPVFAFGEVTALSSMSDGFVALQNNRNGLMAAWEVGWQNVDRTGYEVDLTYDRYLNSFTSVFAGGELSNSEAEHRGIFGVRYLLPLMLQSQVWVDTAGDFRFSLRQSIPLTARLSVFGGGEYDTLTHWESVAGLEYFLSKRFSLVGQWHSEYGFGGGAAFRF